MSDFFREALEVRLPDWAVELAHNAKAMDGDDARMALVIEAALENVKRGSGGPFAAAVFEEASGRLVSLGVNLVQASGLSLMHAETAALSFAQKRTGSYDLSAAGLPELTLYSSAEPCAMCLGAVAWAGVRRLVCGARAEDVESIGFDEGAKPERWAESLEARGVRVTRDVRRQEAEAVLHEYARLGGAIYNPHRG